MTKKETTIQLKTGVEATPVAMLVQVASRFESSVYIETEDNKKVNAKSIMGMMGLNFEKGVALTIIADGADEEEACEAIDNYLSGKVE
ncbi:MAG: HPr family phosphocarrier protein [Lachnospiraceae bacterium]|nr:HPr family phosphocarrier protein [Lachnospiraceae bacterium]